MRTQRQTRATYTPRYERHYHDQSKMATAPTASAQQAGAFLSPMLVSSGGLPHGAGWAYEVKWDGIRGQVAIRDGRVTVRSRPGRDCSESFPELADPPESLTCAAVVLDGEIVWLDRDGHPDFSAVRARLAGSRATAAGCLAFMAFDVLSLDDEPSTYLPYSERRRLLEGLSLEGPSWRAPASFDEAAPLLAATRDEGLEGVVAKRLDSPYTPGERSAAWIKHKHLRSERLTVIGHARSARRRARLLVASCTAGELRYRGVVELGLARDELWEALRELARPDCPLAWARPPRGVSWVSPKLDVEVRCHGRHGALCDAALAAVHLPQ